MSQTPNPRPVSVIVMGPSGVGKTTTALGLAERLGWMFAEADEFHPAANVEKMSNGIALTDADRAPWLETLRDWISGQAREGRDTVLTCSALRHAYRDVLRGAEARVLFLELVVDKALVAERLALRKGHYMPASLLDSQFATLEPLTADEAGAKVVVDAPPAEIVERAIDALALDRP